MKQYFELNRKEKKQEWVLIILFLLFAACIAKGVWNQFSNIDQDFILVPLFFFLSGFLLLVLGINGIQKGSLLIKYSPFRLADLLSYLLKKTSSLTDGKVRTLISLSLGVIALLAALFLFSVAIFDIIKHS